MKMYQCHHYNRACFKSL
uniref:Uncharacterized protein n=1 Tax=Anguilla anguilla TaxID=7936 RepID=A0A0E9VNH4_ANGAN